jgi:hypothetical protein
MKPSDERTQLANGQGPPRSAVLIAFTLFGSYCLGANVAIALHECGHALGCWIAGGKMIGLVLSPQGYSGSYAWRDNAAGFTVSHGYLIHIAGGIVFGAAFGGLLALAASLFRRGTLAWVVTYATGTWSIGNNGMYLLLGSLQPFDDALGLTEEGVPRWVFLVAGLPLVVGFLALFASFLRGIGLRREDSYRRWLLTVETGFLLYVGMIVGLRMVWPGGARLRMGGNEMLLLACGPLVLLLLASCTYPFRHRIRRSEESPAIEPRWAIASGVLALGLLFMAVEVLLFSYDFAAAALAQAAQ